MKKALEKKTLDVLDERAALYQSEVGDDPYGGGGGGGGGGGEYEEDLSESAFAE